MDEQIPPMRALPTYNSKESLYTKFKAIFLCQILFRIMGEQISPMRALPLQTTLLTHSVETPTETTDLRFL